MEVFIVSKQSRTVVFVRHLKVLQQLVIKNNTLMELTEKVIKIKSLLSTEQVTQDIVEIENNSSNQNIIDYLESIGAEEVKFEITSINKPGYIQEKGGITYLWYKKSDGNWIIKLWEINRLLN